MPNKKDPAFLFYSTAFYEGTRTMFPEERACYIDLLIYQHQHGEISLDKRKLLMYCSGISQATLEATLEAKFQKTESGYINIKLSDVIEDRAEYTKTQSKNGTIGQFYKKAKATLKAQEYKDLKNYIAEIYTKDDLIKLIEENDLNYELTIQGLLEASLKHIIKDTIIIKNTIKDSIKIPNTELINTSHEKKSKIPENLPTEIDPFEALWIRWKKYKFDEFKYKYKSDESELLAKKKLWRLSQGDIAKAIEIVENSMSEGYKGLFELKKSNKPEDKMLNHMKNGLGAWDIIQEKINKGEIS